MTFLRRLRMRRAAKSYAHRLVPWLQRNFGASEHYTPAQIRRGIAKLGLSDRYIAVAYAGFLPRSEFEQLFAEMPVRIGYQEARDAFARWRPVVPASSSSNAVWSGNVWPDNRPD